MRDASARLAPVLILKTSSSFHEAVLDPRRDSGSTLLDTLALRKQGLFAQLIPCAPRMRIHVDTVPNLDRDRSRVHI